MSAPLWAARILCRILGHTRERWAGSRMRIYDNGDVAFVYAPALNECMRCGKVVGPWRPR